MEFIAKNKFYFKFKNNYSYNTIIIHYVIYHVYFKLLPYYLPKLFFKLILNYLTMNKF